MTKVRKTRNPLTVSLRIVYEKCKQDRSVRPVKYLFGEYRYGSRGQFKGSIVDYVKYCRRLRKGVEI